MSELAGLESFAGIIEILRDEKKYKPLLDALIVQVEEAKKAYAGALEAQKIAIEKNNESIAARNEMAVKHNDIHQRMEPLIKTTQEMSATLTADKVALAERERQFEKTSTEKRQELDRREKSINVREDRVTRNEADISAREQAVSAREADLAERARRVQQAVA